MSITILNLLLFPKYTQKPFRGNGKFHNGATEGVGDGVCYSHCIYYGVPSSPFRLEGPVRIIRFGDNMIYFQHLNGAEQHAIKKG